MILTNIGEFLLLLLSLPNQAAPYSDRTPQAFLIDDRHLSSDLVICESSNDCSYDSDQQSLAARDIQRCKDEDSCLLHGGSVDLAGNDITDEVIARQPFATDSRVLHKPDRPRTGEDVPPRSMKFAAAIDDCRLVCYVMAKTKPEMRLNSCIMQFCAVKGVDRLPAMEKRWGNRVGRWSKRWGNRVCLEAHCRPFEGNYHVFVACGQSQCHGK